MRKDTIVQFVSFETILDTEYFISKWELFNRPVESNTHVVLQQCEVEAGSYKYLAQHWVSADEFQFIFSKAKKTSRAPEIEIRTTQIGGYSILSAERNSSEVLKDENKLFIFISESPLDIDEFKIKLGAGTLNVYEAFYENCKFQYILEFFAKSGQVSRAIAELKLRHSDKSGIYKICLVRGG